MRALRLLLDNFYSGHSVPHSARTLLRCLDSRGLSVPMFIIEAGAHDGSDTLEWARLDSVQEIYAFEPDPKAFSACQVATSSYKGKINLWPFCLSDSLGMRFLSYGSEPGDGNSAVHNKSSIDGPEIRSVTLEWLFKNFVDSSHVRDGLLWLDVEGHAVPILQGAKGRLLPVKFAHIEVEFKDHGVFRMSNWKEVIALMKVMGYYLYMADMHPGNFGNYFFVHKNYLSSAARLRHSYLVGLTWVLRECAFPFKDLLRIALAK
jgi:FkbM family methyltransferase